ncbi:MAG: 4Fe-4S binding protein [Gammaproteobacteria bacterium]|nr:4Fe-4S binding protein [Gammaproteobacteria bacterium]
MKHSYPVEAALAVLSELSRTAQSTISYESDGNLLLIGESRQVETVIESLSETLHPVIVLTDQCLPMLASRLKKLDIPFVESATVISVQGYLGQFHVNVQYQLSDQTNPVDLDEHGEHSKQLFLHKHNLSDIAFDLILDLQQCPSLTVELPPPGYFSVTDPAQLEHCLEQLTEWVGIFDKPKYFHYYSERCTHSRNSISGCQQCLDHCPAQAITSIGDTIEINPYLCQGCGDCTTTCPTGAVTYRYPVVTDLLDTLRQSLKAFYDAGGQQPVLLFYEPEQLERSVEHYLHDIQVNQSTNIIPVAIESVSSIGLDTWLAALAYGACSIIVLTGEHCAASSLTVIKQQLTILDALLQGLGITSNPVQYCDADSLASCSPTLLQLQQRATFSGIEDKRRMIRLAMDWLQKSYAPQLERQALPEQSPFGAISVNQSACTLCMSCVSACPQGALLGGGDQPQLNLLEVNCVQCGLCDKTCPESAITLKPGYVYDIESIRTPQRLKEDDLVACVHCGKPFIGANMLASMFDKIADHPMYQGNRRELLQMCSDCRVIAINNQNQPAN